MNRRQFLTQNFLSSPIVGTSPMAGGDRTQSSNLDPFVPNGNWDLIHAGHLLRRTTMLPTWADLQSLSSMSVSDAVDALLNTTSDPAPPSCANDATESTDRLDTVSIGLLHGQWNSDGATLRTWYASVLRDAGRSIVEKMVLFWSGHFTSQFKQEDSYVLAPLLYRQNQLFRGGGLGNFKDLVMGVTLDGAMLVYLGGDANSKGAPNENYARELMELFTMGLGQYTEGDVQHAARILTGWRVAQYTDHPTPNGIFNTYFDPSQHDTGAKTFLNVSFPARDDTTNTEFIVRKEEVKRLIDTIFAQRGPEVAKFIARKIYRFFVYSNPSGSDEAVIAAMAQLFLDNNFEIKPVMAALLKSAHFFDNANIGAQIKTPAEYIIGLLRQVGAQSDAAPLMTSIGQELFNPPNVSGWPGYHDWITTNTYPVRSDVSTFVFASLSDDVTLALIKSFPNYDDAKSLIDQLAALVLPRALSTQRETALLNKLTANAPVYEWPTILSKSASTAARNVRDVLQTMSDLPDFQLC